MYNQPDAHRIALDGAANALIGIANVYGLQVHYGDISADEGREARNLLQAAALDAYHRFHPEDTDENGANYNRGSRDVWNAYANGLNGRSALA